MRFFVFLLLLMESSVIYAEEIYIGFILGAGSKGGIVLGLKVNDKFRLETHVNAVPDTVTYGFSLISNISPNNKNALILGYSRLHAYDFKKKYSIFLSHREVRLQKK